MRNKKFLKIALLPVVMALGLMTLVTALYSVRPLVEDRKTYTESNYEVITPKNSSNKGDEFDPKVLEKNGLLGEKPKKEPEKAPKTEKLKILTLTKRNTLTFNKVVTSKSVAKMQNELIEMSGRLKKSDTIYVVLYTPGGSVRAGMDLIESFQAIPQKVKTVTLFAASMGFHIAQALEERIVTPSGTYMSHRARVKGLSGEINGEMDSRLNQIKRLLKYKDEMVAKRMKVSYDEYQKMIADELWVMGFESRQKNIADRVVLVRCDKTLSGTRTETIKSFFGSVKLKFSNCPLIKAPIDVEMQEEKAKVLKFMDLLYGDPVKFYHDYIATDKYSEILVD